MNSVLSQNKQRNLDLVAYLTYTNLRVEASRNYLNFLWWLIEPLFMLGTYYILFAVIIEHKVPDFVPFLMIGLVCWQWFNNSVAHAMTSVQTSGSLIRQVYFPKILLPLSVLLVDAVKSLFVLTVLLLVLWSLGLPLNHHYISFPLVLLTQAVFIAGVSLIAAAIIPFLPDIRLVLIAGLHLMFFLSGVLFVAEDIPQEYLWLYYLNPMAILIESWRDILLYDSWPDWQLLGRVLGVSLVLMLISTRLFKKFEPIFPNIVED